MLVSGVFILKPFLLPTETASKFKEEEIQKLLLLEEKFIVSKYLFMSLKFCY